MDNLKQIARQTYASITVFLHSGLAALGAIAAIALLMGVRPVLDHGTQPSPARKVFDTEPSPPADAFDSTMRRGGAFLYWSAADSENPQYHTLALYLSRRYKVALDATKQLVGAAHETGISLGMDPLLILSVMAIESSLNPIAESVMGAKGLMQVMPKYHQDKLEEEGGENLVLDPTTNIKVGTRILKDAMRRGGGLMPGLQLYAGAFGDASQQYAQKVIAERARMQQFLKRPQLARSD